jgi:hypothetical protein
MSLLASAGNTSYTAHASDRRILTGLRRLDVRPTELRSPADHTLQMPAQ